MSLGSVQNKIWCAFEISVLPVPSEKRSFQPYKVVATDKLRDEAIKHDIHNARPSEKLDGTCVLIASFQGKPWLWARHDRKPTKKAEKKFKAFQNRQPNHCTGAAVIADEAYDWDVETDFREVPEHWEPALGVEVKDGVAQPDSNGHIPGWVPVNPANRQQCWHLTTVRLDLGLALILREDSENHLEIVAVPLAELEGHTAELIGTNVNGNPYKLGCKQCPLHVLVVHGSIGILSPPALDITSISDWLSYSPAGGVEGIVWHCPDTTLFKLHRHHTGLPWPVKNPSLTQRPVTLRVDLVKYGIKDTSSPCCKQPQKDLFCLLGNLRETKCDSVSIIHAHFQDSSEFVK